MFIIDEIKNNEMKVNTIGTADTIDELADVEAPSILATKLHGFRKTASATRVTTRLGKTIED